MPFLCKTLWIEVIYLQPLCRSIYGHFVGEDHGHFVGEAL